MSEIEIHGGTISPRLPDLAELRYLLRTFLRFSEECAEAAGITAQHYQLLQVVATGGAEGSSITVVAQRMLLRHNSAVELVDRAERAGLVRRAADQRDHRRSLVQMTEKGETLLGPLVEKHLGELDRMGGDLIGALGRLLEG